MSVLDQFSRDQKVKLTGTLFGSDPQEMTVGELADGLAAIGYSADHLSTQVREVDGQSLDCLVDQYNNIEVIVYSESGGLRNVTGQS